MIFDPFFLTLSLAEGVNKGIILALGYKLIEGDHWSHFLIA